MVSKSCLVISYTYIYLNIATEPARTTAKNPAFQFFQSFRYFVEEFIFPKGASTSVLGKIRCCHYEQQFVFCCCQWSSEYRRRNTQAFVLALFFSVNLAFWGGVCELIPSGFIQYHMTFFFFILRDLFYYFFSRVSYGNLIFSYLHWEWQK